ncbi:hypothetical protein P6U16_25965 (plasmid) [Rhizobium sp. 32-5/1]|uniref:hypothetical protein n=1 Tax=Rhizobium sp. 32-5/1 TaxID=3019602 RepID=UPI00240D121D|nr:hypothetical protein [Rhizobium sp. 32-5/1]WEZ85516.1 hypothetical protein P6U16_25965 [Rhizobium sp. 32-5/1]
MKGNIGETCGDLFYHHRLDGFGKGPSRVACDFAEMDRCLAGPARQRQAARWPANEADLKQFPEWQGLPVQACTYTDTQFPKNHVTTTAYLLFPSADQLASCIVNACVDAGWIDLTSCTGRLASRMWTASNGQFLVPGYIVEGTGKDFGFRRYYNGKADTAAKTRLILHRYHVPFARP